MAIFEPSKAALVQSDPVSGTNESLAAEAEWLGSHLASRATAVQTVSLVSQFRYRLRT
ncbi:hypothetical protein Rhow_003751 [Rhodococcus wratislaviensis]|uniref:Uncharacterized protein n=1 Tax=Rhodococcus wratislaviensis TaxID=44752 RepID=A0A402C946_RHOWR|nr:hypothetical protein Rhow_003751 [Rhodococcus wratislaviensis]